MPRTRNVNGKQKLKAEEPPQQLPIDHNDDGRQEHAQARTALVAALAQGVVTGPGNVGALCRRALLAYGRDAAGCAEAFASSAELTGPQRDTIRRLADEMRGRGSHPTLPHDLFAAVLASIDCPNDVLSGMAGEALGKLGPESTDILAATALQNRGRPLQMLRFLRAAARTGWRVQSLDLKMRLFHLAVPGHPEIRQYAQRIACIHPVPESIDLTLIDPTKLSGFGW